MAPLRALMTVMTTVAVVKLAMAADHIVGAPNGSWDLQTSFVAWASANTFHPGDTLTFSYTSTHNVLEVSQSDFVSCSTSNPISSDASGTTVVKLTAAGKRYFICGTPGHCPAGMKVAIDTVAAASGPPPKASTPGSPPAPTTSTASSPSPAGSPPASAPASPNSRQSPPSAAANSLSEQAAATLGLGLGMVMLWAL